MPVDAPTLWLFVPACFALNMAPGPNNLLSVSNATRHGFATACLAGSGRLVAFAGMIAVAATGLAVALLASQRLFTVVKVGGALYLFWLAWQLWRAAPSTERAVAALARPSLRALAWQEFVVAASNPKAILIFTAFLPQFVDAARPALPQFAVLGTLFLLLEWVAIGAYAAMGSHLRRWFSAPRRQRWFNRVCGALLGAAGLGLLAARRGAAVA
jgi:threonine/homoserine/homoserine lactone efflux protein